MDAGRVTADEFALFVTSVQDYAILMLDPAGHVVSWNAGAERIKGYSAEEIIGQHFSAFYSPDDVADGVPQRHLAEAAAEGRLHYEGWRVRKDGTRFWAEVALTALVEDGELSGYGKVTRDLTERRNAEVELLHRSLHDELTGLHNRASLLQRIREALASLAPTSDSVLLLRMNLDRFKTINDTLGHEAGDRVLTVVGQRLSDSVGPGDTVARLGADEFVVLCRIDDQIQAPAAVAEHVAACLDTPVSVGGERVTVSASIGVSTAFSADRDPESLLRDADLAMYEAKGNPEPARTGIRLFEPAMRARVARRLELERSLEHAVQRGEMSLVYQPIARLGTGQVDSFEALLRWHRPELGPIPPVEFIPLAERTGMIRPIGTWVLEQACRQAVAWKRHGSEAGAPGVSVNISARQLHHGGLVEALDQVLAGTGMDPADLSLEVTETQLIGDEHGSIGMLTELKARGVSLSIDDFGTGYSSLSYLKRLPVDVVKIDRSFVAGLGADSHGSAIVAATVMIASALDLEVVAEGIETPEQLDELQSLGCHYGQGWHIGRPHPADAMATVGGMRPTTPAGSARRR